MDAAMKIVKQKVDCSEVSFSESTVEAETFAYRKLMGVEKYGRVRGYGTGVYSKDMRDLQGKNQCDMCHFILQKMQAMQNQIDNLSSKKGDLQEVSNTTCQDHDVFMQIANVENIQRNLTSSKQNSHVHIEKENHCVLNQKGNVCEEVKTKSYEDHDILEIGNIGNDQRVLKSSKQSDHSFKEKERHHVLNQVDKQVEGSGKLMKLLHNSMRHRISAPFPKQRTQVHMEKEKHVERGLGHVGSGSGSTPMQKPKAHPSSQPSLIVNGHSTNAQDGSLIHDDKDSLLKTNNNVPRGEQIQMLESQKVDYKGMNKSFQGQKSWTSPPSLEGLNGKVNVQILNAGGSLQSLNVVSFLSKTNINVQDKTSKPLSCEKEISNVGLPILTSKTSKGGIEHVLCEKRNIKRQKQAIVDQMSHDEVDKMVDKVLSGNPGLVIRYRRGEKREFIHCYLSALVVSDSKRRANTDLVNEILWKKLDNSKLLEGIRLKKSGYESRKSLFWFQYHQYLSILAELPNCCKTDTVSPAVLIRPSCFVRYDTTPFYGNVLDLAPPPPPPPSSITSSASTPPSATRKRTKSSVTVTVIPATVCLAALITGTALFVLMKRTRKKLSKSWVNLNEDEINTLESLRFSLGVIKHATQGFADSNKLGQGGFGVVYKGVLSDGQEIAVKRLGRNSSGEGDVQFKNEILILAKLQHRNLVRLLGYCLHKQEMLLVYEFMPNRSLDKFLFDPLQRESMLWETRYKVINGISRGLLYLHEESRLRIIHRDLKAANVLLDSNFNAKIGDFGMARLFDNDQTRAVASNIAGTFGYMPPEYVFQGQVSMKLDVYSFGVLILEIVSGQRINKFQTNVENPEDLLNFAWRCWRDGTSSNFVDPTLSNSDELRSKEILKCIHIGLLCVQHNPVQRPTMSSIAMMLRSDSLSLPVPNQPALFIDHNNSKSTPSMSSSRSSVGRSVNLFSISVDEFYPR